MIIKSSVFLLTERIVNSVSSIFTMIVAARLLAADDFGVYTYNTAIFGILIPLVYFGLNGILVRALLDAKNTAEVVVINAMLVRVVALGLIVVGLVVAVQINDKISLLLILALSGGVLQVFESYNQAFHRNHVTAQVRIGVSLVFMALKLGLLWRGVATINLMLLVFALEFLVYFCTGFLASIRGPLRASLVRLSEMNVLVSGGIFLLASGFAEILNLRIDQVMVAEMIGTVEAGQYAIAARLVEFPVMFGSVVAAAYFPKFYSGAANPETLFRSLRKFNAVMAGLATVFVLILFVLGPFVVHLFFGKGFDQAALILTLFLPCIYILFFRIVISKWILATGIYWYSLFSHTLGAVVNIALNFILIPEMGVNGAVLASIISYSVACWIALLFSQKTRGYLRNAYIG